MINFITTNKSGIIRGSVILLLVLAWHIGSLFMPGILLPSPYETFTELIKMIGNGEFFEQISRSIIRMLIGLGLGLTTAILCGLLAGRFESIYEAFRPIHSILLGLPPIIVVVLAMVWFGTGSLIPIFVVSVLVFPVTYLNTADGWRNIDKQLIDMAIIYRSSLFHTLRHIIFPGLSVPILSAISLSTGSAVRITIMAELLGSNSGIGYSLALARVNINTAKVFAWTIVCILIIILVDHFLIDPFKRYILRWNNQKG